MERLPDGWAVTFSTNAAEAAESAMRLGDALRVLRVTMRAAGMTKPCKQRSPFLRYGRVKK